ncbi:MAG: hypothetical protein AMXMBFR64_40080 [Myxococcales bacterium]
MKRSRLLCVALFALLGACSEGGVPGAASEDVQATPPDSFSNGNGNGSGDVGATVDVGSSSGGDVWTKPDGDYNPDDPSPGQTGWSCESDADCESGHCVETVLGMKCTEECTENCPADWVCKNVALNPQVLFLCMPPEQDLCKSCNSDTDCGGANDRCIEVGAKGTWCAVSCKADDDCIAGYACKQVATNGDGKDYQCLPKTGSCICTPELDGTTRECQKTNGLGTCYGTEKCDGANGWGGCTAKMAAPEVCNGEDDDCDGLADEGLDPEPCEKSTGWGKCFGEQFCAGTAGWKCDAKEATQELCNGKDDNCDGVTDEGWGQVGGTCDGDDEDTCANGTYECANDGMGLICVGDVPKAEKCNGLDDDCDGFTDEDFAMLAKPCDGPDPDTCAAGLFACTADGSDVACVGDVNTVEVCDGADNDCDGATDEGFPDFDGDLVADCVDPDDDSDGDPDATDCEPKNPAVHAGAVEVCNGLDDDCDGVKDQGFPDTDGDGVADCVDDDDDGDGIKDKADNCPLVSNPTQVDTDDDGLGDACDDDDDNDGLMDPEDNCPTVVNVDQLDFDKDGKGDACDDDDDNDTYLDTVDCNPFNAAVNPGASEICDGLDNNCNGIVDEGSPDTDGDGLKDCTDPDDDNDGDPDASDCAPLNDLIYHGAYELCDGKDNDCDGLTDEGYPDVDQNGVPDCADIDDDGDGDPDDTDCAPQNPAIHHGAKELCDGIDNNCNALVDEGHPDTDGDKVPDCMDEDDDNDGLPDGADNCPLIANPGQSDWDKDGKGDACDDDDDGDGDPDVTDCAPLDASISTKAAEVCNGKDDNCNGQVDEAGAQGCTTWYQDKDDDGFGSATNPLCLCGPKSPHTATKPGDCDDVDSKINPLANEQCNGVDDDCDGQIDEADALGCTNRYFDGDADGFGVLDDLQCLCAAAGKYQATAFGDCNDTNAAVNPGAPEQCDGIDNNCNGQVDEKDSGGCTVWYQDFDADGFGVGSTAQCLCKSSGSLTASKAGDCDDNNALINPASPEVCNGKDDNCNGSVDEDGSAGCTTWYRDGDADGWGASKDAKCLCGPTGEYTSAKGGDCDDSNAKVNPDQKEICNNADDDCDGWVDNTQATGCTVYYLDKDNDGYGLASDSECTCGPKGVYSATIPGDCDDLNPSIHPEAPELCNSTDDNCNGIVDEGASDQCVPFYKDADGDSWGIGTDFKCLCGASGLYKAIKAGDCNDTNALVNPGAVEICGNGLDDNCDGKQDEPDSKGCTVFFVDADKDNWGVPWNTKCLCAANAQYSATVGGDCDDTRPEVNPAAKEVCNNIDDDCDGVLDTEGSVGCTTRYLDADGDSWGKTGDTKCLCGVIGAYTASKGGDCNDAEPNVWPGAVEKCNGIDDDCDGVVDEEGSVGCSTFFLDADGDGFGLKTQAKCLCAPSGGYGAILDGDCNDNAPLVNPAATEVCGGGDDDCDGLVDEAGSTGCTTWYKDLDGDGFGQSKDSQCLCAAQGDYKASVGGDCNDTNPIVSGGSPETCNGYDDDCDGDIDEAGADGCVTFYVDGDKDGYGAPGTGACVCKATATLTTSTAGDCNDGDATVHPGATEDCNGKDDNCNGQTDEGQGAPACENWFADKDKDGFGVISDFKCYCGATGDYSTKSVGDCNDGNAAVSPSATEKCDGVDNDCDGLTDEAGAQGCQAWFQDKDADGYGKTGVSQCLCGASGEYSAVLAGDCDDNAASVNPGAKELCNTVDDDCDGVIDEEGSLGCGTFFLDVDGDKYGVTGQTKCLCKATAPYAALQGGDCDDTKGNVNPAGTEVCNGYDDNCNGAIDELNAVGCLPFYKDEDQDEYGVAWDAKCACSPWTIYTAVVTGDCDDTKGAVNPGAAEKCNGADDDCDGIVDEENAVGCTAYIRDFDKDGYGKTGDTLCLCAPAGVYTAVWGEDCQDDDPAINPDADEVCNSIDDDCDGYVDEGVGGGCVPFYWDGDGDGWGNAEVWQCQCGAAGNYKATKKGDCNDVDADVHPAAIEACNGKDDDCDGVVDEQDAFGCQPYYLDVDVDGFGVAGNSKCLCAAAGQYSAAAAGDCNDADKLISPAATEACNGKDDDCDGAVDEQDATGCTVYFIDKDQDGFGLAGNNRCLCAPEALYSTTVGGDCDDTNSTVKPGAQEACNGFDDNCNGQVDELGASGCVVYYEDADSDGYGKASVSQCLCSPSGNFKTTLFGDCADADATVYPGASEKCNGKDDNCNGQTDEQDAVGCVAYLLDTDGDGYGVSGTAKCFCAPWTTYTATVGGDCADGDGAVHPGATEVCNGKDDDCNGVSDDENAIACQTFFLDQDGDGFGKDGVSKCLCAATGAYSSKTASDCNDTNGAVYPGAPEICNGVDDNCNAQIDELNAVGCLLYYKDADDDGYGLTADSICSCKPQGQYDTFLKGDCNDASAAVFPGATEACNGLDDDCDGLIDEAGALGCQSWYKDVDADGWGKDNDSLCLCAPDAQYSSLNKGDCDDTNANINPAKKEACNGFDDNCDGSVDEQNALGCVAWFEDVDGDGYGKTVSSKCQCGPVGVFSTKLPGDCDDNDATVSPGKQEVCNGKDTDCDGIPDDGCDKDGDGYCDINMVVALPVSCPGGPGDCNDMDQALHPGAVELCDGIDNDCDGQVDEGVQSPCGGCNAVCQFGVGPFKDGPFVGDGMDGTSLDPDGNVILNTETLKFQYIWISNSGQGTVSKLSTTDGKEVARYNVCNDPSRTAVDSQGNGWIACRGDGAVVKIAFSEIDCIDKNSNGTIETSRDVNGNGKIEGNEMLAANTDECVLFKVAPDGSGGLARALGIDWEDNAWVGMWNTKRLWRIHRKTGQVLQKIDVSHRPYGIAIAKNGLIWTSSRDLMRLSRLDPTGVLPEAVYAPPSCQGSYGLAIDEKGRIWIANYDCSQVNRFDPATGAWVAVAAANRPRGVAADGKGNIFVALDASNTVIKLNSETAAITGSLNLGANRFPIGMAVDFDSNVWAVNYTSSSATKINPANMTPIFETATGANPYTYSDMTGFALKTVVAPLGYYRHIFEGWAGAQTQWQQITADFVAPTGTAIEVRFRAANTLAALSAAAWSTTKGPFPPASMPINLAQDGTMLGRFVEVEVKLISNAPGVSPVLKSLSMVASLAQ